LLREGNARWAPLSLVTLNVVYRSSTRAARSCLTASQKNPRIGAAVSGKRHPMMANSPGLNSQHGRRGTSRDVPCRVHTAEAAGSKPAAPTMTSQVRWPTDFLRHRGDLAALAGPAPGIHEHLLQRVGESPAGADSPGQAFHGQPFSGELRRGGLSTETAKQG
jgi:hypothetical protein